MTNINTPTTALAPVAFEDLPLRLRLMAFYGHGRLLETYLVVAKLLFAIFLIQPGRPVRALVLQDLVWSIPEPLIAAPFFCVGVLQGIGLIMNYRNLHGSWVFRFVGAFLASLVWGWVIVKSIFVDAVTTGLMPFAVASLLFSFLLMFLAVNGIPTLGKYVVVRQP